MRKFITSGEGLPRWSAPISHAVVVDNLCFVSGQLSIDEEGRYVAGTTKEETARAFQNVFAAVREAGFAREDISFVQVDLIDLRDIADVNVVFESLFEPGKRPARTVAQAAGLPYGARVKLVAVAARERAREA
ncbi:RidA family protein [Tahibacter amnicola]|uniref:RidA family protein n=1 Tax=Tahibacter amnicola TaxID=2976241 RepID=A0ABY6BAN4_9GAMM|nr:RidA family protein [Tahibacter amnicola]UXI66586.1 RidA family protein [Tahibacter amnicola]